VVLEAREAREAQPAPRVLVERRPVRVVAVVAVEDPRLAAQRAAAAVVADPRVRPPGAAAEICPAPRLSVAPSPITRDRRARVMARMDR
jgi:hypothetical protein